MSTCPHYRARIKRREGGTAAVEMALLSFVMAMVLLAPIMIARSLMQVSLAQRAAYNAVHMIATYPVFQRLQAGTTPAQEAEAMATQALIDGGISPSSIEAVSAYCPGSAGCSSTFTPTTVAIDISADLLDPRALLPTLATVPVGVSATDRFAN